SDAGFEDLNGRRVERGHGFHDVGSVCLTTQGDALARSYGMPASRVSLAKTACRGQRSKPDAGRCFPCRFTDCCGFIISELFEFRSLLQIPLGIDRRWGIRETTGERGL